MTTKISKKLRTIKYIIKKKNWAIKKYCKLVNK